MNKVIFIIDNKIIKLLFNIILLWYKNKKNIGIIGIKFLKYDGRLK